MMITRELWSEAILALRKTVAMYELLHTHAAGETDLTETQLANVVTGVADQARETLERMRGCEEAPPPGRDDIPGLGPW